MIISDIHGDILVLPRETDSDFFLRTCLEAKAEISRLLLLGDYEGVSILSTALSKALDQVVWKDAETMMKILPAFPVNKICTFKHLGKNDEIDHLIISSKLDVATLSTFDGEAWTMALAWARASEDTGLVARMVGGIATNLDKHSPVNFDHLGSVLASMVQAIAPSGGRPIQFAPAIDATISAMVAGRSEHVLSSCYLHTLAEHGLKKTLMRMIEQKMFSPHVPHHYTEAQNQTLYSALPATPTPSEALGIQRSLKVPGFAERILFDPEISMEGYITALKMLNRHSASSLGVIALYGFKDLLTREKLSTPDRKRRACLLINAAVDEDMKKKRRTPEDIRMMLEDGGFDPYVLKLTRVLKGTILEEELGL